MISFSAIFILIEDKKLIIDYEYVKNKFVDYVSNYDPKNPKIALKIAHTYRVAELCKQIAESINLSKEECDLAWLMGMLHDIGRFEQVRRYNTFVDAESVDHALLGCEILFEEGYIKAFEEISFNKSDFIEKIYLIAGNSQVDNQQLSYY